MFGRHRKYRRSTTPAATANGAANGTTNGTFSSSFQPTEAQIKRATRTRLIWALISSFLLLVSVVFLILVEIGNIKPHAAYDKIYFILINIADIVPVAVPNAVLINSIAQSLGLHDFYTVGLWGYCQGNWGTGVTGCSSPETLYWFNPVDVIKSQLLAGAQIAFPAEITSILDLIKTVSHWMFGLFLTGACLNFVMLFIAPVCVYSRWGTLPIMIFTFLGALCTTVAAVIATVMFVLMKDIITSVSSLNIKAHVGVEMFAFMWIAAGTSIIAWLIQFCLTCCCASRRDVSLGKKKGNKHAYLDGPATEKPARK